MSGPGATKAPALKRTTPRIVELPKIGDALRGLWRTCSAENGDSEVARSLAINFVGVADASREGMLRDAVERLQLRTPCRAFVVLLDSSAKAATAEVAATTRMHGSTRDIVLEEIVVRVPEASFERIPGLVRPLLVNDLPNHLYWTSPWPRDEHHFDDVATLCDHVVVDSRTFEQPARDLALLDARRKNGARITDLNWLRLRPWRRALAEGFERVTWRPGTKASATITHGKSATAASQLLAKWIGEKLAADVRLGVVATANDALCPGGVDVLAGDCQVQLEANGNHIAVHVTTPEYCYLPLKVPESRGRDGDLLAAAIDLG